MNNGTRLIRHSLCRLTRKTFKVADKQQHTKMEPKWQGRHGKAQHQLCVFR